MKQSFKIEYQQLKIIAKFRPETMKVCLLSKSGNETYFNSNCREASQIILVIFKRLHPTDFADNIKYLLRNKQ